MAVPTKHESPSWRDWTVKDWAEIALVVVAGYVVKRLLPDGWFSTLGVSAYIGFFVVIWWKRRRAGERRLPTEGWRPQHPGPRSDS